MKSNWIFLVVAIGIFMINLTALTGCEHTVAGMKEDWRSDSRSVSNSMNNNNNGYNSNNYHGNNSYSSRS